jgi:hypothetical protein
MIQYFIFNVEMNNNCSLAIKALFKKKNIENSITFRCIIGIRQEENIYPSCFHIL